MSLDIQLVNKIKDKFKQSQVPGMSVNVFNKDTNKLHLCLGKADVTANKLVTKSTIFHACSMSKMVTAMAVLRLVQQGLLNLETNVNEYLKAYEIKNSDYTKMKKVTLRNLLAHQAGFEDTVGSFAAYNPQDVLPTIDDLLKGNKYAGQSFNIKYVPESKFSYSDAGYCVVEKIIESVTNKSISVAIQDLVIQPLGLKKTFILTYDQLKKYPLTYEMAVGHDKFGNVIAHKRAYYPYLASAGLWTTTYEMSVISQQIIKAWNNDKTAILDSKLAKLMLNSLGEGCNPYVGLGVFLYGEEVKMFQSQGWGIGFQCMLLADANKECGVVVMINCDPGTEQNHSLVGEVIKVIKHDYLKI
ncbi:beta-lactamase family protein [Clostridium sp. 'deep sea']|uniref:serine hydrolase domain-containing protein n=1 Tax=Clostridium sp. 'deep sea' TaxID=2779445 RepID=UPI00189697E3|nr:serine hydrolase domain-containing protein [Clostridium sp. 'deep sea']QOR35451.1 beta-lactamase family protein [Clostridium sp. 'deep sea']